MSTLAEQLVLKEGDVFLLSHENGDIRPNTGQGLYHDDTRFLSVLTLTVNGQSPALLSFTSSQNFMGTLQFANEIQQLPDGKIVLPQTISMRRSRFISEGLHERVGFVSYNPFPVPLTVTLTLGSDFRDIFDIRGFRREKWGKLLAPEWDEENATLRLRYLGLDGITRTTEVYFDRAADDVQTNVPERTEPEMEPGVLLPAVGAPSFHVIIKPPTATLTWNFDLTANSPVSISMHVLPRDERNPNLRLKSLEDTPPTGPDIPAPVPGTARFDRAVNYMRFSYWNWETQSSRITTDHAEFNHLLRRSQNDLRVLSAVEEGGYFPSAGIPWYACPFGRDSLIVSLQTLPLNPQIAIATLRVLARYQGTTVDPRKEEQPGKILHELRLGEMARLGLVPHTPYYGTVDATPLFVLTFVELMRWLDDDGIYEELLPNVWRAIEWIDQFGDVDGDGFVEYIASTSPGGIRNQVWKDSGDSVQFPDGELAETPVAAVEVQAYVYAAKLGLSELLRRKGDVDAADRLMKQAAELRERFNSAFWMPEAGFYCQALDKGKRQVPTISSNPAHCMWCDIADIDKAKMTVERLMQPDMVSGWGIRTISDKSPSYNPMSYHNGSVWPHDCAIAVAGFKRYGFHDEANAIITQISEAARYFRYSRLPELYCGFTRDRVYSSGPAEYPVSCSPQAWAAGAGIQMLQAMLGLQVDAASNRVRITPRLPEWINTIQISNMRIGEKRIDVVVHKHDERNEVYLSGRDSGVALEIV